MSDSLRLLRDSLAAHIDIHGPAELAVFDNRATAARAAAPPRVHILTPTPVAAPQPAPPPAAPQPKTPLPPAHADSPYERILGLIPESSPLREMETLAQVSDFVRDTVLIDLDRTRINPVFGVGSPTANLMIIGEAPGADEDQKGEPFVGRAGQLLTKILEAIGFLREDVYIANILKSRPPKNRDPLPEEVAAHVPILYKQMTLIQPRLLLCVGRTAGNTLLGMEGSLKSLRGKFHDFHGLPTMVTYHPAALLRNSKWKRPTWEDVQTLRKRYDALSTG